MAPSFQRPRALGRYLVQPFMLTRPVSLARRATVIAGKRYEDDFTMIWRGLPWSHDTGQRVPAHLALWSWNVPCTAVRCGSRSRDPEEHDWAPTHLTRDEEIRPHLS